tara:strand:+ start:44 stop:703 length:660 start_codon:yes stop_codon:yes gene_type:complete
MNTTEILTKIKTLLGVESEEVRLAQMKLEDGLTIVESDFEAGAEIMIVTEDGKVAMPVGDYTLEDGRMVVVKEEGLIEEIKEAKEEEVTEEVVEEEARSEEEEKEMYKEETKAPKKVIESITKESFFSEIEKLKEENETLKKELEGLKLSSEETSVENTKEESVETKEEVKETTEVELSTEEVNPIVFNPENKKEVEGFKYSRKRGESTIDRVMRKISE